MLLAFFGHYCDTYEIFLMITSVYSSRLHTSLCLHYGNYDGTSYGLDCLNLESCTLDQNEHCGEMCKWRISNRTFRPVVIACKYVKQLTRNLKRCYSRYYLRGSETVILLFSINLAHWARWGLQSSIIWSARGDLYCVSGCICKAWQTHAWRTTRINSNIITIFFLSSTTNK